MIKPAALILAVAMGAVSAGTYYGLDLLPPGTIPEPFGRAVQKPEPPKPGAAAPAPVAAMTVAAAPAPEPAPADQPVTEQDLAEDPPPQEPVAQAAPAPAPEPEPAPAEPAPAPKPQPAPRAESPKTATALQDAPPPPRPAAPERAKAEVVRGDSTEVASAAPAKPQPPDSDVIKPWWPDSSKLPANQLKLQYAGQVQGEQAIALLFSAPLNVGSLRQHAQVRTEAGAAVNGAWELGKNPRLAVFRGVDSGRFTVILSPQVADTKGFMLGQTLKGPVYIQPPQ